MRHPAPCRYDDSISSNPDADFCNRLPTCPGGSMAAGVSRAEQEKLDVEFLRVADWFKETLDAMEASLAEVRLPKEASGALIAALARRGWQLAKVETS